MGAIFYAVGTVLVWLRDDLRLDDNPVFLDAIATGQSVAVLYILPGCLFGDTPHGAAAWWLHYALADLDEQLLELGMSLNFMQGDEDACLRHAMDACGARDVFWTRRYGPEGMRRDPEIATKLRSDGYRVHVCTSTLLREPEAVLHDGLPYKVFSHFHKAALKHECRRPLDAPLEYEGGQISISGAAELDSLGLLPAIGWDSGIARSWVPSSAGLAVILRDLPQIVPQYDERRDFPSGNNTSRLSPYLRFGQISPARLMAVLTSVPDGPGRACFEKELHWREFAYSMLHHFPMLPDCPLAPVFENMPWREDLNGIRAWQRGLTGYPIVDAGMRQLWRTGWMHNRVRMIAGSFLVKDLLVDWRQGAEWFMDTLVDADEANNSLGWQWVAGSGPDAAPYFRVFNPVLQGRRFDPHGFYVRKYIPELAFLPNRWIHEPWMAPEEVLAEAGVCLGRDYPFPILEHNKARIRALDALKKARTVVGG